MPLLGIDRRLQSCSDRELADLWRRAAPLLVAQQDPISGRLPPAYQKRYEELVAEFARRGVQLTLWGSEP